MTDNPYQSPATDIDPSAHGMSVEYRVFEGPWFYFSARNQWERLRREVQAAIADEIGAENVISVLEHDGFPFSIVIWYRVREASTTA